MINTHPLKTAKRPALKPSPVVTAWSDMLCDVQAIMVDLSNPGVCDFIREALDSGMIRVAIHDAGRVLILPSRFWLDPPRQTGQRGFGLR